MLPTRRKDDVEDGVQEGLTRMGEKAVERAEAENSKQEKR